MYRRMLRYRASKDGLRVLLIGLDTAACKCEKQKLIRADHQQEAKRITPPACWLAAFMPTFLVGNRLSCVHCNTLPMPSVVGLKAMHASGAAVQSLNTSVWPTMSVP